jgi:hypothetical protein
MECNNSSLNLFGVYQAPPRGPALRGALLTEHPISEALWVFMQLALK